MTIDLVVLGIIGFYALLGLWRGAVRQVAQLGGLVAGYFGARPLADLVAPSVAAHFETPPLFTSIACSFVLFFAVYLLAMLLIRFLLARILPDGERGVLNRAGGFMMGGAKAAAVLFVVLSIMALIEKRIPRGWTDVRREIRGSIALQLARQHNLFAHVPQFGGLERIVRAGEDPETAARLAEDPEFKAIAADPRMESLAGDKTVQRALQTGDYASLLSSAKVLAVLNDPALSERLLRLASGEAKPAQARPGEASIKPKSQASPKRARPPAADAR